jgi:hypothetical protein
MQTTGSNQPMASPQALLQTQVSQIYQEHTTFESVRAINGTLGFFQTD